MSVKTFLHELTNFGDLIGAVSREKSILPQLIEKDYWIMHSLYGLQQQGFDFELKGGTSLSKGYRIIERFDDTAPNEDIDISSWVVEKALAAGVDFIDNRALSVKCYHPAFTFVEKLQAISTKFRQQQASGGFPVNFLRHYYDIYCLLAERRVQEYIGTDAYEERKTKRFPTADVRKIAENEAFILSDPDVRAQYTAEYAKTRDLYYAGMVSFDTILGRIQENIDRL